MSVVLVAEAGPQESERLAALHELQLLDSAPDPAFDRIVRLAQQAAGSPTALLSLVDAERQWFKSRFGLDVCSTSRDISFCTHVVAQRASMWVENAREDKRFTWNPLVLGPPYIRFYAGAPIMVDGQAIGTLCVLGPEPRAYDAALLQTLEDLAGVAAEQCDLHRSLRRASVAEARVETTHAWYRNMFRSTSEPMVVVEVQPSGDFVYLDVNAAMAEAAGLAGTALLGRTPHEVFGDYGMWLEGKYRECVETGAPVRFLADIEPHGQPRTFDSLVSPLRDENGWVSGLLISARDVTDEHAAQTALRLSGERFARLFDSSADALCEMNVVDGRFVFEGVNAAYERATGMVNADVRGRTLHEVFPRGLADEAERTCAECLRTNASLEHETTVPLPGGMRHWIVTMSPLRDRDDAVVRILVAIKDVSERKLLEARRRESQKLESIGQLAGGLAHDFNNLLQVIDGYSRRALAAAPNELSEVLKATERGARLIRQLLVFSCRQISEPEPIRLGKAAADVLAFVKPLLGARYDVQVEADDDAGDLCVNTDANEFCQAMLNFATNARDAMPEGGAVTIGLSRLQVASGAPAKHPVLEPGGYAVVSVRDVGCGMTAETAGRIFDPFYTTKDQGKGTGLGLAMVYGYAQQSGGAVDVISAPGKGTTFRLYLPLTDRLPAPEMEDGIDDLGGAGETVLLVEDDPALLELTRATLEALNYFVLTAENGEDAQVVVADWGEPIDLIVSDIIMPGMGGLRMAEQLRADLPSTPVVFVSGHPVRGELQSFELPAGALFLQKPFRPTDLARVARRALGSGSGGELVVTNLAEAGAAQ